MSLKNDVRDDGNVLTVSVKQDNSSANGSDENIITAIVTDANGGPATNTDVIFKVDGNALFKDNESQILRATTQSDGSLDVRLVNPSESDETNTVTVFLFDNQEETKVVEVHFHHLWDQLSIDSIYNKNKTLVDGQPTIAWCGAEFSILTAGGSGKVSWSYDGDGSLLLNNNMKILTVKIMQPFFGDKILTCIDDMTQEIITYTFNITDLVFLVNTEESYNTFIENNKNHAFPSRDKYQSLFHQWGRLSVFADWPTGGEYWTSEYDAFGAWVAYTDTGEQRKLNISEARPLIIHVNI
ncbi:Ig-like domain-containing protein [Serratia plymuthica]|uniref:Ig-like domain-containing protein n=1 Tax=Serratia plymuthica TaxID=82996 RepID=UPI003DA2427C